MQRRNFITLLGGVILAPPAVHAQQKAMPVIGILDARGTNPDPDLLNGVRKGLAETGYTDAQNVVVQYRGADGHYDRFPALAAEFVRARVGIIVAPTLPAVLAAKAATSTIAIVFMLGDDPVKQGLVASLNKPGGNATPPRPSISLPSVPPSSVFLPCRWLSHSAPAPGSAERIWSERSQASLYSLPSARSPCGARYAATSSVAVTESLTMW